MRDDIWCKMFRSTLREEAMGWYQGLPKGSIKSFFELKSVFRQAYNHQTRRKDHNATLLNIEQETNESLREFIEVCYSNSVC